MSARPWPWNPARRIRPMDEAEIAADGRRNKDAASCGVLCRAAPPAAAMMVLNSSLLLPLLLALPPAAHDRRDEEMRNISLVLFAL